MFSIFFASKKDLIYFSVVWFAIILILSSIIINFSLSVFNLLWGFIGSLTLGLLVWIWFGTGYRIEDETINIENGPFKSKVSINEINMISKRRNLLATPALSLDRLVLQCGKYNEILLSPKNEKEFINLLLIKNPRIKLDETITKS